MWGDDESFKEHCGEDYDPRVKIFRESRQVFFAQYSNGLVVPDDAKVYEAVLRLTKFEKHLLKRRSWYGQLGAESYGEADIVGIATRRVVLAISIDGMSGQHDYVVNVRYHMTVEAVCDDI